MSSPQFVDHLVLTWVKLSDSIQPFSNRSSSERMTALCTRLVRHLIFHSLPSNPRAKVSEGKCRPQSSSLWSSDRRGAAIGADQVGPSGSRKDRYRQKLFIWLRDPDNVRTEFYFRPWF